MSSKAMLKLVIDDDTGKIKVSHFDLRRRVEMKRRTPYYILNVFNSIHFPSLLRLHLDFSAIHDGFTWSAEEAAADARLQDARNEAAAICFPIFVANLAYAKKLESLTFNADATIEKFGMREGIFQSFGKNLARCTMLKELAVVNSYFYIVHERNTAVYCHALTSALTLTLKARKNTLEKITFWVCGIPVGSTPSPRVMSMDETCNMDVWNYFLRAILSCEQLRSMDISAKGDPANDLCVTDLPGLLSSPGPINLENLILKLEPVNPIVWVSARLTFSPLVRYFSNCHALEEICLRFNEALWREDGNTKEVAHILAKQRTLSLLDLSFVHGDIIDTFGIFDMIEDCLRRNQSTVDRLHINGLKGIDANQFYKLLDDLCDAGLIPLGGYMGYVKGLRPGGNIDLKEFGMRRLKQG